MRSLIRKLYSNKFSIFLRNSLNIKPVSISKYYLDKNISISDAFLFRTDNNFKTIFRFSDIANIFYDYNNSKIEIIFYDFNNVKLKEICLDNLSKLNEIVIDKEYLQGIETYGHFYIFHKIDNLNSKKIILSNRCYLGFSKNNIAYSFVHGNLFAKSKDLETGEINTDFINTSLFLNFKYFIQENFSNIDKIELFICNPTSKLIKFSINKKKYKLNNSCDIKIILTQVNKIEIRSNCGQLRPLIFTYNNNFYDVHHG
jgi:hypothetical protein